jgi:O-antigen/teichoic acid export membrane protein
MFEKLRLAFKNQDDKTKIVSKNIIWSAFIKCVSIGTGFLSVPILLNYLGQAEYGIWLTISAFLGWFGVFDLGIGNGLRNKLTEALTIKDFEKAKIYVSTAYAVLGGIFTLLFVLFYAIAPHLEWSHVFNAPLDFNSQLLTAILYLFGALCTQFVLKLILTIFLADHQVAWSDALNAAIQVILLGVAWNLDFFKSSQKLVFLATVYALIPIAILLITNVLCFNGKYNYLKPSFEGVQLKHFKGIGSLGLNFFVIQLATIVIYATDNMLITQLFNPEQVTIYNIAFKYFNTITITFTIILTPFWSMITAAMQKGELDWIKKSTRQLIGSWLLFFCFGILMLLIADHVYQIWTRGQVVVPFKLSFVCFLYVFVMSWGNIFAIIVNAVGKIRLQLYASIFLMLINIPLCIFLVKTMGMGVEGVPVAGILSMIISGALIQFQAYKILNNQAKGIWYQ